MAAFELNPANVGIGRERRERNAGPAASERDERREEKGKEEVLGSEGCGLDPARLREECIIALKVYDSCRSQECLTHDEIGSARAAETVCIGDYVIHEGDIIIPPENDGIVKTQLYSR